MKHNLALILVLSLLFTPGCTTFTGRGGGTNHYLNTRSTILEHLQPYGESPKIVPVGDVITTLLPAEEFLNKTFQVNK